MPGRYGAQPVRVFSMCGVGTALPGSLVRSLAAVVGPSHVLTGDAAAAFAVGWTGRFRGHSPAVVRPRDTAEVAAVLALCTEAGIPATGPGGPW